MYSVLFKDVVFTWFSIYMTIWVFFIIFFFINPHMCTTNYDDFCLYPLNITHILCNIPFLNFMSNSLSPVRVAHMCMHVGPSSGAWETMSIRVFQRYIYLICLCLCTCLCTTLWLVPTEPREGTGSPEIGVIDASQLAHWCWELNLHPLKSSQFSYCWLNSPAAPCSF